MVDNTGADFFARYSYNSPKTKCNGYIVTVSNGLSRILMSYLGIKGTQAWDFFTFLPKPYGPEGM